MSFDVFMDWFRDGEADGIPLEAVRDAFQGAIVSQDDDVWELRYDAMNSCTLYLTPAAASAQLVEGLTVNRPCGSDALWQALFSLLARDAGVLYWPGGAPLIAHAATRAHLPTDMIEALGDPRVISSWSEITGALSES